MRAASCPTTYLLETCDPALVKMELDLCWIAATGKDPLDYFRRYPGRFPLVHVKGLKKVPVDGAATPIGSILPEITEVGHDDVIDWKRIFAQSGRPASSTTSSSTTSRRSRSRA